MKFCQGHWDTLRENVKAEGLYGWVSQDGKTAVAQIADQMQRGELTPTNFDPLMSCHNMIMERTIQMVGLSVLTDEFGCPICFFNAKRTEDGRCACGKEDCGAKEPGTIPPFESWLEQTPKATRLYMIERGWLADNES